jgi:hypothetical protein
VFCNVNRTVFFDKDRTMDNVQKHNIYILLLLLPIRETMSESVTGIYMIRLDSFAMEEICNNDSLWLAGDSFNNR